MNDERIDHNKTQIQTTTPLGFGILDLKLGI